TLVTFLLLWFLRKSRWRIRIMISNEKKRVVVTLTKEVADNLDKIAKQMGLSKSGLITIWVNANGKENEQKK
ncbi:ribbon-helix-helix domain-containing protein, partial [Enterococcus faecium]